MIPTSDIKLLELIQCIQTNRIVAKGKYEGTIRKSLNSKVPSVVFTLLQKIKALSPEFLSQIKEYDCLAAWIIAADIARAEAGLKLCQSSDSLSLHGRRAALRIYYKDDPTKAKTPISNKPCNSQFCPFCAIRRVEELEAKDVANSVYAKTRPYVFCYGSFLSTGMLTDEDVNYSIAALSGRAKDHDLLCGMRKFDYERSTNRIIKLDYIVGTKDAKSIAGYTPLVEEILQPKTYPNKEKIDAFTTLMPTPSIILQIMRLDPNVMSLLKFSQRSTFRLYETHRTTTGQTSP